MPDGWEHIPLVNGPSAFFYVLALQAGAPTTEQCQELATHRALLADYKPIVAAARAGSVEYRSLLPTYHDLLESHMGAQEARLFPRIDSLLGDTRFTRELRYEHQGVRSGLKSLSPLMEKCLQGQASRKEIDKQELDLLHLLEHHLEREQLGLVPLLRFLKEAAF